MSPAPPAARALLQQGLRAHQEGRLTQAAALFRKALGVAPNDPEALRLLALTVLDQGMPKPAIDLLRAAASLSQRGLFWADLGRVLHRVGDGDEAEKALRKAASLSPQEGMILWDLALILRQRGQLAEARTVLEQVCALQPAHQDAPLVLAQTLMDLRILGAAITVLTAYLARYPGQVRAHVLLGMCHMQASALGAAAQVFQRALAFSPHDPVPLGNLSLVYQLQGKVSEAIALNDRARASDPQRTDLISNRLMAAQYVPGVSAQSLFHLHRELMASAAPAMARQAPPLQDPSFSALSRDPNRRLRIGYVSPDLARHPVGAFLSAVLPYHDPSQVEVIAYSDRWVEDEFSATLKASPGLRWQSVAGDSTAALVARLRADQLDLCLDLTGHTANNRLAVFAARVAPVQLTWAGYVGTTGLASMDGLIADSIHVRPDEERWYHERVWRLPHGYVAYAPPPYLPEVGPCPAATLGQITFGCTNGLAKLNPGVAQLWAKLLAAVPKSRLVLKTDALSDRNTALVVADLFAQAMEPLGIDMERLVFAGRTPHKAHLDFYHQIDILLDPFPYSGGLTTLESLWMGVPVITMPGSTFASRHSTAHLTHCGLAELCVADGAEDYLAKACALAADVAVLAKVRGALRDRVRAAPMHQGPDFTHRLEGLYRQAWHAWLTANPE